MHSKNKNLKMKITNHTKNSSLLPKKFNQKFNILENDKISYKINYISNLIKIKEIIVSKKINI